MTTRDPFGQPDEIAHATPVVSERPARGCVRPDEALEAHARGELELSEFERGEIAQFPEVWFTGLPGGAKPSPRRDAPGEVSGEPSACGFADARLDYAGLACAGDHLAYRYEIERVIGKGSFAKVAQCFDHKRNERVAVKVVRDAPRFHKQVEIEVAALRALGGARGCVELLDVFAFRGHRCLVFELVSMSLRDWLTTHAPTRTRFGTRETRVVGASVGMCRRVAGQLLDALAFLTEKSIIHCDLKLENVLLRSPNASEIVLVDFGSACFANAPRNAPSSACACVKSHAAAALAARSEARLGSNSAETSAATFRVGVSGSASPKVCTFAAADHRNRRAETSAAASRNEAACSDTRCAAAAASGFSASGSAAAVPNELARATSTSDGLSDHLATQSARASASARLAASNGNQTVARSTMRPPPGGPACTTNARAKCASTTSRMNPWSRRSVSGAKNRHRHASRAPRASSSDGQTVPSFCFRVIPNPRPGPSSHRNLARSSVQLSRASSAMKAGSPNRANAPAPGTPRRTL